MSIHDFCCIVFVSKSIKSNLESPVLVNHVEVDISGLSCAFAFAVLNQGSLTRDGDADEVRLVQRALAQSNRIHKGHRVIVIYIAALIREGFKEKYQ